MLTILPVADTAETALERALPAAPYLRRLHETGVRGHWRDALQAKSEHQHRYDDDAAPYAKGQGPLRDHHSPDGDAGVHGAVEPQIADGATVDATTGGL